MTAANRYEPRNEPTLNSPRHIERMKPVGAAKSRFHSPSKLDLARRSRKFRNSYSAAGIEIRALGTYMQAHLPEMRSYWFRAPTDALYPPSVPRSFSPSACSSLALALPLVFIPRPFHHLHPSSIFPFYLSPRCSSYLPTYLPTLSLHPRGVAPTPRWHSFLLAHFYRRIFRSQFVGASRIHPRPHPSPSPIFSLHRATLRSRKEAHSALETASKNDYSEINNNDITAPRRSIRAEMVFIG